MYLKISMTSIQVSCCFSWMWSWMLTAKFVRLQPVEIYVQLPREQLDFCRTARVANI